MYTFFSTIKVLIQITLAALLVGCGISPVSSPAISTPEEVLSPSPTQPLEQVAATETVESIPVTQPPSSLDPLRVAYIKDGNLWLWMENGESRQLTSTGNINEVILSDDGLLAAFTRQVDDFQAEIWVINTDGKGERLLVSTADIELMVPNRSPDASGISPHQISWIPGTHALAFNTRQSFMVGFLLNDDLRLVNATSGEQLTLIPAGGGGMFYYSPDGSQIAITTPNKLFLLDADGSNLRSNLLSYEEVITASEYRFYPKPVWSADSSSLLVAIPPRDPLAARDQATTIWRVSSDGSPAVRLGGVPDTFFGGGVAFSPDLSQLIYQREVGLAQDNLNELHQADIELKDDRVLFTAPMLQFHGWAGDSQHFFFSAGADNQMHLGSMGGSSWPVLQEPGGYFNITVVSEDQFLYIKEDEGAWELGLANLDGQKQVIDRISGFPGSFDFDK
jgi:dipeptidyl aminopeptidase/acylaminoacyl peptidase